MATAVAGRAALAAQAADMPANTSADTSADTPAAGGASGYGGFQLGALNLALPMTALREVVPRGALAALPCPARCVIGAISLRGVAVPVVDLRLALGQDASAVVAHPSVIIMVHEGRILGLLADGVTGVFDGGRDGLRRATAAGPAPALLAGSIQRDDDQTLVSVLSPAALAALPQVPMVDDPEPGRQPALHQAESAALSDASVPVMLMRCGRVPLAIDAMAVHATLSIAQIDTRSVLAMGDCRGVIDHAGLTIPVVDLLALCGLGRTADDDGGQAFVVRVGDGLVAFLVGEVVDVVRTQPGDVVRVPGFALPRAALFAGALPTAALPAEVVARTGTAATQFLLIDPDALRACPDVAGLAATNTRSDGTLGSAAAGFARAATPGPGRCSMITYALGGETATPIDQVAEILPYVPESSIFGGTGGLLGLVVNRGRSIPVMCLSALTGTPQAEVCAAASVLVVESDGELLGFAVPQLKAIELADWKDEPAATPGAEPAPTGSGPFNTRCLARVGSGDVERLLPVLDLQRLARTLQAQAG